MAVPSLDVPPTGLRDPTDIALEFESEEEEEVEAEEEEEVETDPPEVSPDGVVQIVPRERAQQRAGEPAGLHFGDDGFVYLVPRADPGGAARSAAEWLGT